MDKKNEIQKRESIRLQGYDYSKPGYYYVTICTKERLHLFGQITDGRMLLNEAGKIAEICLHDIPNHYPLAEVDYYSIMPNHIHVIIIINDKINKNVGVQNFEPLQNAPIQNQYQKIIPYSLGSIVKGFKIGVTKWFRQNTNIKDVWQRNYYEHIIRNDKELFEIRKYIELNPFNWGDDEYNKI